MNWGNPRHFVVLLADAPLNPDIWPNCKKRGFGKQLCDSVRRAVRTSSCGSLLSLFARALLQWLEPSTVFEQGAALLLGCAVLGFGVSIEVAPGVLLVPGEGAVRAISTVTHRRFGSCKIAFDSTLAATAVVLSSIFFGTLNGIGLGTLVSALLVGTVVNFCNRHIPLTGHIVNLRIRCDRISSILKRKGESREDASEAACCAAAGENA